MASITVNVHMDDNAHVNAGNSGSVAWIDIRGVGGGLLTIFPVTIANARALEVAIAQWIATAESASAEQQAEAVHP